MLSKVKAGKLKLPPCFLDSLQLQAVLFQTIILGKEQPGTDG